MRLPGGLRPRGLRAMTDFFALLEQPRSPWLDPGALRDAFHRLSARSHPDVRDTGDAAHFQLLNAANTTLREPATRLRHLLELIAPEALAADARPPAEIGDLFMRFGSWQQRAGKLIQQQAAATSPLARALLAGEEAAVRRELAALQLVLEDSWAEAEAKVRGLGSVETHDQKTEAARLYQHLVYLGRWRDQAREAALRWNP
jgi:curved DNA-binding protein CbpA